MSISEDSGTVASSAAQSPGNPPILRSPAFLGISVGNFLILMDAAILNVALPDVRQDLHAPVSALSWTVDAYTVVFAGLLLASGAVADRYGAHRVYRVSLISFAALSLLCGMAQDAAQLIGGRALLGMAAAGLVPASLALLASRYPDPATRSRAIGAWAALTSFGLAAGPVLGGFLVSMGGWRLVFLVNPPIALAALLAARGVRAPQPGAPRRAAPASLLLSTLGLAALAFGLIDGGTSGWARAVPVVALGSAGVLLVALVLTERRVAHPVLPPDLLRLARVRADIVTGAVASLVFYGVLFFLSLWLHAARGMDPVQIGLTFLPMTVPMCFIPYLSGRAVARFGARPVLLFGLACDLLAGLLLLPVTTDGSLLWVVAAEIALVLGSTTAIPAATADIALAAPSRYAATAQGALNAGRQAGSALGVALVSTVTTMRSAGLGLAAAALLALLVVLRRSTSNPAPQ